MITIQNVKNQMVNLGTIDGVMVVFGPYETKTLNEVTSGLFEHELSRYIEGGFLSVTEVKKKLLVKDESTKPLVTEVVKSKKKRKED